MHPRINEGRTYGSSGRGSTDNVTRKAGDFYRPTYTAGQSTEQQPSRHHDSHVSFLSRSDILPRRSDPSSTTSTADPDLSRSIPSLPRSAGLPGRPQHPVSSRDIDRHYVNAPADLRSSSTAANPLAGNNASLDRPAAGQVRGILRKPEASTEASTELKTSQNTSTARPSDVKSINPLLGQKIVSDGLLQPIKPLSRTLADLRAGKPWSEAFQGREASHLYKTSEDDMGVGSTALKDIPQLSVYFPLLNRRDTPHDPTECGKLCHGAPHVDRGSVCRFCLTRLGPRYKDQVSEFGFDPTRLAIQPGTDGYTQTVFRARECLDHLQSCSGLPNDSDRKLLYDAFRKADERFIEDYHTSEWKTNISLRSEARPAQPTLAPRVSTQAGGRAASASRSTSGSTNTPAQTRPDDRQPATRPIAAKQVPNNPPRAPASHHATGTNAIKLDTRINGSSVLTETNTPVDEGTGWGVSARDFALQQPAEETLSEQDELEEPQHDPEDDFTWQAVKEMLKTAPASSGQAAYSNTVMNPPLTSNGDEGMVFGVEIIPEPQSAPRGAPGSPSQHTCAPPSGSASQNALLDRNGSANSGVAADVVDITARVETASVSDVGTADMDIASNSSSIASATGPSGQTENVLFRPITPPPALEAKEESTTPTIHDNRKREGTQDIPEPELPAEDPWDLIPEPGFEPFLTRDAFVRSGAPSLESRLTSRNSSPIPEPQAEPLFKPADLAEGVDEADKPALDGKASPEAVVGAVDNAQDASSDKATKASKRLERKNERHAKSKEKKKARLKEWRGMRKQQKKEKLAQIRQEESVQEAEAEAKASKSRQERSPSVECLNPIRPVPSRRQAALETGVTGEPRQNYTDDEDDDMLLKDMPSSQAPMNPRTTVEVHEISSSDNDSEEGKDHGKAKFHKSATAKANARPSIGPVAIKTMRRGKYRNPTPTQDLSSDDSDSDSSDDSAPFVTSKRVENYIPRAVPLVQVKQAGKQRSRLSAAAAKPKPRVSTQPVRLPTPSSDSDSDNEDEQTQKAPTASQIAAAARRFQRFASRDRSPARKAEKGKKKRKDDSEEDRVQRSQKDDTPSRIIRRRTLDYARESSSPARPTKRKAKVIETTDDENDSDKPGQKRLKSYEERQVELARASSSSQAGTSRRGSLDRSGSAILPVNAIEQSEHKPEIFFVDVEKNVDNLLALPPELEPWEDIFEAAEILNLDTLRDCIGSADNADDFVKWVLARTGRKMPLAKQFPMVQALQHVLSEE